MILLILLTIIAIILFREFYWKRRLLPPGPIPMPLIGNMIPLFYPPPGYVAFNRWTKQYGDIYTFWLGSVPYVMINTYEKMKETFIKDGDTYIAKVEQDIQKKFRGGIYGVIETNGYMWREHRRFALSNMRDFGLGKDLMQAKILIDVEEMFKHFDASLGTEVDVPIQFELAAGNVINQLLFGYHFDEEHAHEFVKMKKLLDFQTEVFSKPSVIIQAFAPWTRFFIPGKSLDDYFEMFKTEFYDFFNTQIEKHRNGIDYTAENNSDYCEAYLKEQKKREADGDYETFGNTQLSNMCLDLWFAGLVTTHTTISWAFGYLLNTTGVQEKLHEELDRVVGSDRLITTSDKSDLPYMNAFINESQRCANIVPINLFHMTTKDTEINGYPIKKGTGVIAQISTVMMDEKVFPEPETFKPDRFIENGKLKKIDEFVPFSVGKRACLGEGLARLELFLFISNFFNRYSIEPSSDGPPPIDKTKDSGIKPRVFNAILTKRS